MTFIIYYYYYYCGSDDYEYDDGEDRGLFSIMCHPVVVDRRNRLINYFWRGEILK